MSRRLPRHKSTYSSTADCVEVLQRACGGRLIDGEDPRSVRLIRDTKNPMYDAILLREGGYTKLLNSIKRGELDLDKLERYAGEGAQE